jgi:probable HAF family extracellular repeat protein
VKYSTKVAFASCVVLMLAGFASAQAVFTAVKVPGSSPNAMISINNGGWVVVNTGSSSSFQVSVWNRLGGEQTVGLIGNSSGGAAINNSGEVVGAGDPDNSGDLQSFLWQSNSGVQWLGSLGGNLSAASGLNDSGAVVGLSYNGADYQHAFLWTPANGLQDLTPDLTSLGGAFAVAINNANEVAGYYFPNGSRNTVGFTWTEATGLQSFGPSGTLAFAVNASGTVVGQSTFASAYKHAFSWTPDAGITDLGTLGGDSSSATGINTLGWIVGTSLTSSSKGLRHGFLRMPTAAMKDLNTMSGLSANIQISAASVNDAGVIAASTNKGGYLLVPKMTAKFKSSANPSIAGQPVTLTATITSVAGAPPDGDTVLFSTGGKVLGTATLSGGVAQLTTSAISVGSHAITANFSGDVNYLPTKYANALTQVVNSK